MTGKLGTAPCGHPGEYVTTNYVRCTAGCETLSRNRSATEPEIQVMCPKCCSRDVAPFITVFGAGWHCWTCSRVWYP